MVVNSLPSANSTALHLLRFPAKASLSTSVASPSTIPLALDGGRSEFSVTM
jgi:hypothetical protein